MSFKVASNPNHSHDECFAFMKSELLTHQDLVLVNLDSLGLVGFEICPLLIGLAQHTCPVRSRFYTFRQAGCFSY